MNFEVLIKEHSLMKLEKERVVGEGRLLIDLLSLFTCLQSMIYLLIFYMMKNKKLHKLFS